MDLLVNNLKLSEEELQSVSDLAGCNYAPAKIALYLSVAEEDFLREFANKESELAIHYERGRLLAEFAINNQQRELAEKGNITAAQVFFKEADRVRVENLRNHILFGHED